MSLTDFQLSILETLDQADWLETVEIAAICLPNAPSWKQNGLVGVMGMVAKRGAGAKMSIGRVLKKFTRQGLLEWCPLRGYRITEQGRDKLAEELDARY